MTKLVDLGLTLANIDLGSFDAESDVRLAEYFVTTSYVARLTEGPDTLFLGRKGSGKSGVFTQLPRLLTDPHKAGIQEILLTPDAYAWESLKAYEEQGLLAEHAHTNAWKLTLAIQLAATLAASDRTWSREAGQAIDTLKSFLAANFGEVQPTIATTAASVLQGIRSLNLSAFGFGVGVSRDTGDRHPITPAVTDAMFTLLSVALAEQGVLIALDRLDESWDGSTKARTLLIGLLKAGKEINARFGLDAHRRGLRVLTFLRTDIYDGLEFDDKDKHRQTERRISWSIDELREMVDNRLPKGATVDDLFGPRELRQRAAPFNYLVKRTYLRPREVLQFVDACIKTAGPSATEIIADDVYRAEETFSGWKVDDLRQEFRSVYPDFGAVVETLRQETHRYDSATQVVDTIRRKRPDLVEKHGSHGLIEMLFDTSVLGVRPRNSGTVRFRADLPTLQIPTTGAVYVHQSLRKGLNVTEARSRGDEDEDAD